MAPPTAVPATPPTFHFKMRLVDANGKARFAGKDYQLWWGGKLVKEGQMTPDGGVEADVDDNYDSGLLDVGERDDKAKFVARWTIPIDAVPPPPPPPKAFTPPAKATSPKRHSEQGPQWTDEFDPPPPFPVFPRSTEDEDGLRRYREEKKRWDEWESRRAQRIQEAEKQKRADEEVKRSRAAEEELRRKYSGNSGSAVPARDTPAPPMSAADKQALQDRMQRFHDGRHAARVRAYDLAWRLRNLGYLPASTVLVFPLDDRSTDLLLEAERRYAHKNKLTLPEQNDLVDAETSDTMKALSDAIKKEHDG